MSRARREADLALGRPVGVVEDAAGRAPPGDGPQVGNRQRSVEPPAPRAPLDRLGPQEGCQFRNARASTS